MSLKSIQAFGQSFDLAIRRNSEKLEIEIEPRGGKPQMLSISPGDTTTIHFE